MSQNDVIAFRAPDKEFQLTWFDRRGNKVGTAGDVGLYSAVSISPDDSRVATVKEVFRPNIDQDIWTFDSSGTKMARVTFGAQLEKSPVWSADGKRLIFTTTGEIGSLFEQVIDRGSSPTPLLKTNEGLIPTSVSADGRFLLYEVANVRTTRMDIWISPSRIQKSDFRSLNVISTSGRVSSRRIAAGRRTPPTESGPTKCSCDDLSRPRTGEHPNQRHYCFVSRRHRRRDGGLVAMS